MLSAAGYLWSQPLALQPGLIWLPHIAFDRVLGDGLKLPAGLGDAHLGRIGRGARPLDRRSPDREA